MNVIIAMASEMKSTTMANNSLSRVMSAKEFSTAHEGIYLKEPNAEGHVFFACGDGTSGYVSSAAKGAEKLSGLAIYETEFEDGNKLLVLGKEQVDLSKLKKLE